MPSIESLKAVGRKEDGKCQKETASDVDQLVSRLTDTLRLKAKQKLQLHKQSVRKSSRPYPVLSSQVCCNCSKVHRTCGSLCSKKPKYPVDSHDLLKFLLKEGNLIKEAVARLKGQEHSSDERISNSWNSEEIS